MKSNPHGFTLIEILVSLTIMIIIFLGVSAAYTTSVTARIQSKELAIVMNAARSMLEYVNAEKNAGANLDVIYNKYRTGSDFNQFGLFKNARISILEEDPDVTFDVDGKQDNDPSNDPLFFAPDDDKDGNTNGLVGRIEFPENPADNGVTLTELADDLDGQLARDLGYVITAEDGTVTVVNKILDGDFPTGFGNGAPTDPPFESDVQPANLQVLPIRIFIRWQGGGLGTPRVYRLSSVLIRNP